MSEETKKSIVEWIDEKTLKVFSRLSTELELVSIFIHPVKYKKLCNYFESKNYYYGLGFKDKYETILAFTTCGMSLIIEKCTTINENELLFGIKMRDKK